MKKNIKWIIGALVFVLFIVGAYFLYDTLSSNYKANNFVENTLPAVAQTQETTTQASNSQAPDFTVIDKDGNKVSLSDFKGKPVVLNLWASWCPPCKQELPDFENAYKNHTDLQFMMVNMTDGERETEKIAKDFISNQGYTFPVFYDTEYSCAIAYNATSLPATYFIDKDGNLIAKATGMIDAETLEKGISMIK